MNRKFKAVAFDVDGTLTKLSRFHIPWSLLETMVQIPKHIPLAICSGREFKHIRSKVTHICSASPFSDEERKRWYIFSENGSIGHKYNKKNGEYDQLYEMSWPSRIISQDAMEAFIKDRFGWHAIVRFHEHNMVVYFQRWFYLFPRLVRKMSAQSAKKIQKLINEMGHAEYFTVLDSGIGNIVQPVNSGKGKAMKHWADHLGISVRDILVIGDQAGPGKNDEEFLSGEFGTSFTVGQKTKNTWPLPVLDDKGRKLWGPEGTEYLLGQVKWA